MQKIWGGCEMTLKEEDRFASNIYNHLKARIKLKGELNKFKWKKEDFIKWYNLEEKKCAYCGCEKEIIEKFYKITKKQNKRPTRGNSLEIDRKKDIPYSADNCVLACYWCNNAKTDVFRYEEFKPIGKAIGDVIRKRIRNDKNMRL